MPDPSPLQIDVNLVPVEDILGLRDQYRCAMNCQIVHDSYHARGFTDSYILRLDGEVVGYGSVAGEPGGVRETIKEFYVLPAYRGASLPLFRKLIAAAEPRWIEAQTNDLLLTLLLFDCALEVTSDRILFADARTTSHRSRDAIFRSLTEADQAQAFPHLSEPVGAWGLEVGGEIVATGGLMFHYNPPYADIHMEVAAAHRRKGYGTYLVQELKRLSYEQGSIPAARCHEKNRASRLTLEGAGMLPCARIIRGRITS
jgi:GNAT superfamily N-acetyltransferase